MRQKLYLSPAALLICLFFCVSAYSEKKNRVYGEDADRDVGFYNENYEKRVAVNDRDIISYNSRSKKENSYEYFTGDKKSSGATAKKNNDSESNLKVSTPEQKTDGAAVYYVVRRGDTLFGIAKRSGIPLSRLREMNSLGDNSRIYTGMKLRVPSGKPPVKKSSNITKEKNPDRDGPDFLWPLKKVKGYGRDGRDGVKPIGIIITSIPHADVIASENGVVKKVGYMRGYGKYIVVKHDNRYMTVYSNLMDIDVKAGDRVERGARIGNISEDMTLHFQIDRAGKPENPVSLLPGRY